MHYRELNNACCSLETERRGQEDEWLVGVGEANERELFRLLPLVRSQMDRVVNGMISRYLD